MSQIDWNTERRRLRDRYAAMEDGELEKIARDAKELTEAATKELKLELARRKIEWPEQFVPEQFLPEPPPVMVGRYRDLPDAQVAKSLLNSAGIDSFLADENLVRIDWLWSNMIGGVKLFVRDRDAEAAKKLLEQAPPEAFDVPGVGEYRQPRCPQCQSLDVALDPLDKGIAYAGLLVSLPIPIGMRGYKCNSCGQEWQETEPDA